ncbi:MAG: hypothetical protein QW795_03510 [Candidatus Bathyarchaeia archaeon]
MEEEKKDIKSVSVEPKKEEDKKINLLELLIDIIKERKEEKKQKLVDTLG